MVRAIWMCLSSSMFGALAMFFFDRERGRRRRNMLRDGLAARFRRVGRGLKHFWRGAAAETYGVSHRIIHFVPRTTDVADDEPLLPVAFQFFKTLR